MPCVGFPVTVHCCQLSKISVKEATEMATVVDEFVANFNLPPLPEAVQHSLDGRLDALMGTDAAGRNSLTGAQP